MEKRTLKRRLSFVGDIFSSFTRDAQINDSAFKLAMYNGLAIVLVLLIVVFSVSIYFILHPFIKPLLWALLCGSGLHPFKQKLADKLRQKITDFESSSRPLTLNIFIFSFNSVSKLSDRFGDFIANRIRPIFKFFFVVSCITFFYFYTPNFVYKCLKLFMGYQRFLLVSTLDGFDNSFVTGAVILGYLGALIFLWKPEYECFFPYMSVLVWISTTAWMSNFFSSFREAIFATCHLSLIGSYLYVHVVNRDALKTKNIEEADVKSSSTNDQKKTDDVSEQKEGNEAQISWLYIRWLTIICIAFVAFKIPLLPFIGISLLGLYGVKKSYIFIFGDETFCSYKDILLSRLHNWYLEREKILMCTPLKLICEVKRCCTCIQNIAMRGEKVGNLDGKIYNKIIFLRDSHTNSVVRLAFKGPNKANVKPTELIPEKILLKGRMKIFQVLKDYCDSAASISVILGLLVLALFVSIFMVFQAYREGFFLVQAGGSIINSTIGQNPELNNYLPNDWRSTVDSTLNDAYIFIREKIALLVQNFLKGKGINAERSAELERGALELWDRAYQAWVQPFQPATGATTVIVTPEAVFSAFENFIERLKKTPEVVNWDSGKSLLDENMSTMKAGLDSIWSILWANISLLSSITLTLISVIFEGGISVINFAFQWVVFLSALYYLLSSSRKMYKPVEIITQLSPQYGKRLALAVELSCREVLAASLKLSVFYGLWTWFIHSVFMSNFIYMPAVFAAILGVVPVLGTYWACLPAVLDLWLLQSSKVRAFGLLTAQLFPAALVETTVYNEIKGSGHPYLTGLSVAGGIFWLGIEGAIAGPMLLCFLFTILNMLSEEKLHST